jgi:hypothetical protein
MVDKFKNMLPDQEKCFSLLQVIGVNFSKLEGNIF